MKKISLFLIICLIASFNISAFADVLTASVMVDIPVDKVGESYTNSDGVTTVTKIVKSSDSSLTTDFVSDDPIKGNSKIFRGVCDDANGKAISYLDYLQYNVKASGLLSPDKPHDYIVTSFDVLLGEDMNGVALENRFDDLQSIVFIETNGSSGNVWSTVTNRNQVVTEAKNGIKLISLCPGMAKM